MKAKDVNVVSGTPAERMAVTNFIDDLNHLLDRHGLNVEWQWSKEDGLSYWVEEMDVKKPTEPNSNESQVWKMLIVMGNSVVVLEAEDEEAFRMWEPGAPCLLVPPSVRVAELK